MAQILVIIIMSLSFLKAASQFSIRPNSGLVKRSAATSIRQESNPDLPVHSFPEPNHEEIHHLELFLREKHNIIVITGAGVSTSSGIPDYRGPKGSYKMGHKPIVHSEFIGSEKARKRYWARSLLGWKSFAQARPNDAHIALANLEMRGVISTIVTQNVDRLHQKAGSIDVVDLHGRNDRVSCISCGNNMSRRILQQEIEAINSPFVERVKSSMSLNDRTKSSSLRADGDAELGLDDYSEFTVPCCPRCGGTLKPDVVFFGDNVPIKRVEHVYSKVDKCDGILVVGSSLEVFSAYRFVDRASKLGAAISIINWGETRAERANIPGIVYKSEANCAKLLKAAADRLLS